jgi:hypothetical protein
MRSTPWARVTLVASAIVAAVGSIDSVRHGQWDAFALFTGLLLGTGALLAGTYLGRPAVPVRGDLARWLEATASADGERAGDVADRAIATYCAALFPPTPSVPPRRGRHHG